MRSDEYKEKNGEFSVNSMTGYEPGLDIELDPDIEVLHRLFHHIQETWRALGEVSPMWSVLSVDEFKEEDKSSIDSFYATGENAALQVLATLRRNNIEPETLGTCLEFGGGLGRITRWLAENFPKVVACDISSSHLEQAKKNLEMIDNIDWVQLTNLDDLQRLQKVDLVYTVIVLQHNPPPLIDQAIRALLQTLNPGGVAVFQIPTYRMGYRFDAEEYLSNLDGRKNGDIEMHFLPQHRIFEIIGDEQCVTLEVLEDGRIGHRDHDLSNTFVVRKNKNLYSEILRLIRWV